MKKQTIGTIAAFAGVLVLGLGGTAWANAAGVFERPAVVQEETTPTPTVTATVTPTPTPTPIVEPVVEAPPVEEAPVESGPDLCPAGTTSQSSDGYNDLSCAPDVCLTLRGIPDPDYPECDYFYPPYYYR